MATLRHRREPPSCGMRAAPATGAGRAAGRERRSSEARSWARGIEASAVCYVLRAGRWCPQTYLTPVGAALGGHVPVEAEWGGPPRLGRRSGLRRGTARRLAGSPELPGGHDRPIGSKAAPSRTNGHQCPFRNSERTKIDDEEADPSVLARAESVSHLRRCRRARVSSQGTRSPAPPRPHPSCPASSTSHARPTRPVQVQASAVVDPPLSAPCSPPAAAHGVARQPSWPSPARSPLRRRGWRIGVLVQRSARAGRWPHRGSSLLSDGHAGSRHQSGDGPLGHRADHRSRAVRARQDHRPVALGGAGRGHLGRRPGGPPSPLIPPCRRVGRPASHVARRNAPCPIGRGRSARPYASRIATARVQPAEARSIFTGKQLTMNPAGGRPSRLCSFSMNASLTFAQNRLLGRAALAEHPR